MTKYALYVPLQAKPGKEKEVAEFLRSAVPLVNAEPGTTWFAIQEGPSSCAIFGTCNDEAGRDAHLSRKVAAALTETAQARDLLPSRRRSSSSKSWPTSCRNEPSKKPRPL
jgi:quinol monooxygenase YgiN